MVREIIHLSSRVRFYAAKGFVIFVFFQLRESEWEERKEDGMEGGNEGGERKERRKRRNMEWREE